MNWVDLVVAVVVIAAIANGIKKGAAVQVLSFGGFWAGFALGSAVAPHLTPLVSGTLTKAVVSISVVFGGGSLMSAVGRFFGFRILGRIRETKLGTADSVAGAGISGVATLLIIWLTATMLSSVPVPEVTSAIHGSRIIRTLDSKLPPAPAAFAQVSRLLNAAGFPDVFAQLEPAPQGDVGLPDDPAVARAVAVAKASTVKIAGFGCGGIKFGSGFVVAPGLVVTNAHVVAGIRKPSVQDQAGTHRATPVYFDPQYDLAILRTKRLRGKPLDLLRGVARRGQGVAVLGYPGGGPFTATPGAVMSSIDALGRDIYSRDLSRRNVYQLQAEVHPGNSGGPFVREDGTVVGVVFSASSFRPNISYALRSDDVARRVDQAAGNTASVDTGPCTA